MAGDLERIVLPAPALAASRRHELWRRTCFEVFFGMPGQRVYWEANFSSSGAWNIYRFTDYRQGMAEELRSDLPSCRAARDGSRLELSCSIDVHELCPDAEALALGIACVVMETSGRLSYWAIDHCGASRPDFHDRRGFRLQFMAHGSSKDGMV